MIFYLTTPTAGMLARSLQILLWNTPVKCTLYAWRILLYYSRFLSCRTWHHAAWQIFIEFGGEYCFHLYGRKWRQKIVMIIITALRTLFGSWEFYHLLLNPNIHCCVTGASHDRWKLQIINLSKKLLIRTSSCRVVS